MQETSYPLDEQPKRYLNSNYFMASMKEEWLEHFKTILTELSKGKQKITLPSLTESWTLKSGMETGCCGS